jgi:hypothetical protein
MFLTVVVHWQFSQLRSKRQRPYYVSVSSSLTQVARLSWRQLYEAAMRELDLQVLPLRIETAWQAIETRMLELHSVDLSEKKQLTDSLQMLEDLAKMYENSRSGNKSQ